MMPTKILIDTDPGIDDSMGILFALRSPELEVVGLTAVFGNTDVEITAQNALRLVEVEGHDGIPVAQGAGIPLVMPPRSNGTRVHGMDGLGETRMPPPRGRILNIPAAQFIVETILKYPGEITLVTLGPLTNIAIALRLEPRISRMAKGVVIMGGSAGRGNASPAAEANIFNDPEAAAIVFGAGWPLTMVGLDVTNKTLMTKEYLDDLLSAGNKATEFIKRILPFYQKWFEDHDDFAGAIPTHDPSAIACVLDRSLYRIERLPVHVETQGRAAGQTVSDPRRQWAGLPEIDICLDVDVPRVLKLYSERMTRPLLL
jgi:purine nucleosidase